MKQLEAACRYTERHFVRVSTALLLGLLGFYGLAFLRYRPYDIDDPWFLSFSYGQHVYGLSRDTFLSQPFPLGMDGTYLFGRLAAGLQSAVAAPFGWQQRPAAVLSAICVTLSLGCFLWALRRRGHSPFVLTLLLVTAGLSEPVLSAAVRLRYEPFSYLLVSAGLLLATFDQTFLAVFVAALAMETEPAAMLGVIPVVIACILPRANRGRRVAESAAAFAVALGAVLLLHPVYLHPGPLLTTIHDTHYGSPAQFLSVLVYFLMPRHMVESILLIAGPCLFLRNGREFIRRYQWELVSLTAAIVVCPILKHPNPIYVIFVYPLMLLVLLTALRRPALQALAALVILLYFVPQYAYAAWRNRGQGYTTADMRQVEERIVHAAHQAGLDPATVHIVGDYSLYFAHPHNFHGAIDRSAHYFPIVGVVACFDRPNAGLSQPGGTMECNRLKQDIPGLQASSDVLLHGNVLHILARTLPASSTEAEPTERQLEQ